MSLVGDGAPIQIGGQTVAPAEIGSLFELKAAIGERNELEGCEASRLTEPDAPVQVTCRAQFSNRWTDAVGGVPVDATYFLRIEGDEITAIRSGIDTETFGPMVWQPYLDFVHERDQGNDFGELFASNPDGIGIIGPKLTEQSVALHTRYTEDFEAARDSG